MNFLPDALYPGDRPLIDLVSYLYRFMLDRPADPTGLRDFVHQLKHGSTLVELVRAFQAGDEFRRRQQSGMLKPDDILSIMERRAAVFPDAEQADRLATEIAWFVERRAALDQRPLLPILGLGGVDDAAAYRWWLDDFERPRVARRIAVPVPDGAWFSFFITAGATVAPLVQSIESIQRQHYGRLDIMVLTAERPTLDMAATLARLAESDQRVHPIAALAAETAAAHLARALATCRGAFVARLACGDRLSPIATAELATLCSAHPELELLYTDHDTLQPDGSRRHPVFRAAWDPDLALATDFPGPGILYSRDLLERLGGWRDLESERAWADLRLRAAAQAKRERVRHLPLVLYHASDASERTRIDTIERQARVQPVVAPDCRVTAGLTPGSVRIVHPLPRAAPLISLLIPTVGSEDLLRPCLEGIRRDTAYPRLEVVVVNNGPHELTSDAWFRDVTAAMEVRVIRWDRPFNWGTVNNVAATAARGELLVLLNDDTVVLHPDWLEELARQAMRPGIGAVGARLLYPDGRIQHAGMAVDPDAHGHHVMRFAPQDTPGYLGHLQVVREVSAVTGACMMMRKAVFEAAGGIEDTMLRVTSSDVDLCFRIARLGYRILWTPYASLVHRELATRGADDAPEKIRRATAERLYLKRYWGKTVASDPFWSPNLAFSEESIPAFAVPPRWPDAAAAALPERSADAAPVPPRLDSLGTIR